MLGGRGRKGRYLHSNDAVRYGTRGSNGRVHRAEAIWGIMRGLRDGGQKASSWACFVCVACLLGFFLTAIIWITPWGAHGDCGGCAIISGFGFLWVMVVLFEVSVDYLIFLLSNPLDRWGFCS